MKLNNYKANSMPRYGCTFVYWALASTGMQRPQGQELLPVEATVTSLLVSTVPDHIVGSFLATDCTTM